MKQIFQNTLVIPGDRAFMIGSPSRRAFIQNPDSLAHRYAASSISAKYFSQYMFEELMPPERVRYISNTLDSARDHRINTDSHPVAYYFDLLLWNRYLQGDNRILSSLSRSRIFIFGACSVGLLLLFVSIHRRRTEQEKRIALYIIIGCGGMIGMAFNLLLFLNFQETFGSLYEMLGAESASCLLGLGCGAILSMRKSRKTNFFLPLLLLTLLGANLLLPRILQFLLDIHSLLLTLFTAWVFSTIIGLLFGTVNRLYSYHSENPGILYAFDVAGSSAGALITCSILLPVLGIQEVTFFLALFLVLSFTLSLYSFQK